ncbi:hypothetical protein BKA93DRAFT_755888 [Sparassis latifolia]
MSRGYDVSSEIYSVYLQPMTRASSATQDSESLSTPMDELPLPRNCKTRGFGSSKLAVDAVRIQSGTPDVSQCHMRDRPLGSLSGMLRGDTEQRDSYFAIPLDSAADAIPLARRKTTKELIGRYESMSSQSNPRSTRPLVDGARKVISRLPSGSHTTRGVRDEGRFNLKPPPRGRAAPSSDTVSTQDGSGSSPKPDKKDKGRSPIRQSLRNLLSVFGRKNRSSGIARELLEQNCVADLPTIPSNVGSSASQVLHSSVDVSAKQLSVPSSRDEKAICTTPISPSSELSGPLLYLSRSSSPTIHPVWTNCNAHLHSSHVLVTWHTAQGNPSTSIVSFTRCTDVRSLSLNDLAPEERALLPGSPDVGDVKVFELLFEGRPREKFAARSVGERATWVSTIWDAILQAQERRTDTSSIVSPLLEATLSAGTRTNEHVPVISHPGDRSLLPKLATLAVSNASRSSPQNKERDLPELPPSATPPSMSPVRYSLHDPSKSPSSIRASLSPLPVPPATPTALSPLTSHPSTPSRSQSPSVRNLGQLSMVKQRLAQLERTQADTSSGANHTLTPTGSHLLVTPVHTRGPSTYCVRGASESAQRQSSAASALGVEESIVASYNTSSPVSPLSMYSGRLTSVPSEVDTLRARIELESPVAASEAGLFMESTRGVAMFSPTSQYSSEDVHEVRPPFLFGALRQQPSHEAAAGSAEAEPVHMDRGRERGSEPHYDRDSPHGVAANGEIQKLLEGIDQSVKSLEGRSEMSGMNLGDVRTKVSTILEELRRHAAAQEGRGAPTVSVDFSNVMDKLDQMRAELRSASSMRAQEIEELRAGRDVAEFSELKNIGRSVVPDGGPHVDLSELHAKLDGLASLCQGLQNDCHGFHENTGDSDKPQSEEIQEILMLLKDAQPQWSTQSEQQTDNIRYLNELNSWLEAFVNHGTSQIDGVVAGVQHICRELGVVPEAQGNTEGGDREGQPVSGVLADLRSLLAEAKGREDDSATLHASVNGLIAAVQEEMRRNAEARDVLTTESVVGLINRQRQDHERMLRILGSELSNEIRGERLRFVEAMKEATAINVQIHVEEFKKELTREVLAMTQEVGRLQRERQAMEQQIADLFAFYSKQKQAGGGVSLAI